MDGIPLIPRLEVTDILDTAEALAAAASLTATLMGSPASPPRKRRRPSIARALKEAKKAGNVASVTVDNVTFTLVQQCAAAETTNPFELEARRLRRQRGSA